ncbi:hypothetical protein E2C01_054792 [Portunus trituberculatus]|uniref:Uncharacterized protein n=1 Tax=Portunus trituberculatus TaxID=210409 RepID=A0A5B7GT56_PORTR|nr:hypothetical protein [Portunus trituberculatus]
MGLEELEGTDRDWNSLEENLKSLGSNWKGLKKTGREQEKIEIEPERNWKRTGRKLEEGEKNWKITGKDCKVAGNYLEES